MKKLEFEKLLESVQQAGDIAAGRRRASRAFKVASTDIKSLRTQTRLSQPDFAALLGVEVSTLRNWEQGRRFPEGPALALLRIAARHPRILRENLKSAA